MTTVGRHIYFVGGNDKIFMLIFVEHVNNVNNIKLSETKDFV